MLRIRRSAIIIGLGIFGIALACLLTDRAAGQKVMFQPVQQPTPTIPGGGNSAGLSSIKIIEDSTMRRVLKVGSDCIADKEWNQAVDALQKVLDKDKDFYVQMTEPDHTSPQKEITRWTSVKFAANNLIGSMPIEGLEAYELANGAQAKLLLSDAKKKGDRGLLEQVALRYCHTKAGIEANEILATLYLARGQVFAAALSFEKLLYANPEWAKINDLTLFKAAVAFRRTGDKKNEDVTWDRLAKKLEGKAGLKIGDEVVPLAKLEAVLNETVPVDVVNVHDWPSWRGNLTNTAQASGSPPLLDTRLWTRPIFMDKMDGSNDSDPDEKTQARVNTALKQLNDANQPVLPGFFPIASQGIMVYRSHRDIRAVALKDISIKDDDSGDVYKYRLGEIVWKSIPHDRSLAMLLEKPKYSGKTEQWLDAYEKVTGVPGFNSFLFDNTLIGTLVTDHQHVYAINDLAVPPHPSVFNMQNQFQPQFNQFAFGEMKPLLMHNELHAYDLTTGKLRWDLTDADKEFKDSHFLSLPITVGGKLYVLNERLITGEPQIPNRFGGMANPIPGESELRLIGIDPTKLEVVNGNTKKPKILEPIQVLGNVAQHDRFLQDISRRVNAVQLAYGEGILVCPTNAGEVFGIDLMTRSLVWSYPYRENPHQQIVLPGMQFQPGFQPQPRQQFGSTVISKWKASPPAIQDGKIVFTAPDADSVHCVNLRDGKPAWKRGQQKGDRYMAGVFEGRVLVVGETNIRALDLKTGGQVWSIHTGDLPSGQGVASKGIYYLPLKKGEILAVDIAKGEVKAHNRAAVAGAAPGNLVFYENMVLSQTATEVMAYPQLSARLGVAKLDSANDPENLAKLADYGELLLKDGQVPLAVATLLKVYERKPADALNNRVKDRLFEALTDLMQIDFNRAAKDHLDVYQALCSVPGNPQEEQGRKAKFFRLVGQGREAQGDLVVAFQMYKDFGALTIHRDQGGITSPEDPNYKIPVNVWLRGRISGMIAKAKPDQRAPLEAKIAEEWKIVEAKKDPSAMRSFVGMFDAPFRVGREARVRLAENIMEQNDRTSFLEAELLLQQVMGSEYRADPETGGRALAALAQLEEKKGTIDSMRLASAYYRDLARDFTKAPVRGTKTGADLFNELATDKRFLPFLEDAVNPFGPVTLASRDLGPNSFPAGAPGFVLTPQGDQTPFAKQNRLTIDSSDVTNPKLRLRDHSNNKDRWETNLGHVPMNQNLFYHLYQMANPNQTYHPNARFHFYQVKGHLIVCQVGVVVYCVDGDTGKKLWEMQTSENIPNNGQVQLQSVLPDSEGTPELIYFNQVNGTRFPVRLGRIGTAQASYVAVLGHKGLTVVDPLRGTILWKKADISVHSHVFGDDQYLFLAEANESGIFGAGRTLRASDGEVISVPDFSSVYQARIRTVGRQILAAQHVPANLTVRLYDILSGKDVWSKAFASGSTILNTEDTNIAGILEPNGMLTVLDSATGKVLVSTNLVQHRITPADIKGLRDPLLLQDGERFYVALNKPVDGMRIYKGEIYPNFSNGTRCLPVNGWFLTVQRKDGKKKIGDRDLVWKKGDVWHSYMPVQNQLIVLEQFDESPIILFTARYMESTPNGGNRWVSVTQSLQKSNVKMVYASPPPQFGFNGQPMFSAFQLDLKARTINLIGFSSSVQHYVDDGKGPPPLPQGAMLNPGDRRLDGTSNTLLLQEGNVVLPVNPGFPPININPRIMRRPAIQNVPPIEFVPLTK